MKLLAILLKRAEVLSAVSIRLTYLTGKSKYPVHPKHLIKEKLWFEKYLKKADVILDIGCNTGQFDFKIARKVKKVIGIEVDKKLLDTAIKVQTESKIKNIKFINANANKKLPFKDEQFTKVICCDVLEHLDRRNFALKEINRVLKKGGRLFLVTDNPETSWKRWQKKEGLFYYADLEHRYEYPKEELLKILKNNKLKVEIITPVTYNTPIAPFIDLVGGISLTLYRNLRKWREEMNQKNPNETTGYRTVSRKI